METKNKIVAVVCQGVWKNIIDGQCLRWLLLLAPYSFISLGPLLRSLMVNPYTLKTSMLVE